MSVRDRVIYLFITYFLIYICFVIYYNCKISNQMSTEVPIKLQMCREAISKFVNGKDGSPITTIDLSNCQLSEFPIELFEIRDTVEIINLGGNKLSSLPNELMLFSKLRILFFANNNFEHIPDIIGNISSLYMVSFKSNQIRTVSETALGTSIGWLILTDNHISELPESIGLNLKRLKKLMLAGNKLTTLPKSLQYCKELELIRLAGNRFEAFPLWLFTALPRLSWCAIAGNPIFNQLEDESSSSPVIDWNALDIGQKLGEGASGVVYKGKLEDKTTGDVLDVAVKLFKGQATSDGFPEDEMKVTHSTHSIRVL